MRTQRETAVGMLRSNATRNRQSLLADDDGLGGARLTTCQVVNVLEEKAGSGKQVGMSPGSELGLRQGSSCGWAECLRFCFEG